MRHITLFLSLICTKAKIHASLAGCDDSFLILLKNIYAKIHASLAGCGVEKEEKNYIKWS